jgi:hypothetical protein
LTIPDITLPYLDLTGRDCTLLHPHCAILYITAPLLHKASLHDTHAKGTKNPEGDSLASYTYTGKGGGIGIGIRLG